MTIEREDGLEIIETVNNWVLWRDAGDWERFRDQQRDQHCALNLSTLPPSLYSCSCSPFGNPP